jgi:hypothetical protein
MPWLVAAIVSCVCFGTVALGTLVPLRTSTGITFLFVWPGAVPIAVCALAATTSLIAVYVLVRIAAGRYAAKGAEAADGRWLAPLVPLAVVLLGVVPAVPGIGLYGTPTAYLVYDLRWWWFAIALLAVMAKVDGLIGTPIWIGVGYVRAHRFAPDAVLAASVITFAIVTTPLIRFDGTLHGDEPKYLRFCEVWYQGGGLDISSKRPFTETASDLPRAHRTLVLVLRALGGSVRTFAADLQHFAANPVGFQWRRSQGGEGFVRGKGGGLYQIHQPGLSVVLFPGYVLDRLVFARTPGYQNEFPLELPATTATLLLLYAACTIALFRLFRNALQSQRQAFIWAPAAVVTLPVAAFPFQIYPELAALLLIATVTNYVLFSPNQSAQAGLLWGTACGALVWLHPRFLVVSLCLIAAAWILRSIPQRRWFSAACLTILLSLGLYNYHVTGSWLLNAIWESNEAGTLHLESVPLTMIAYLVHPQWGLLPHAPILVLASPGLILLWRHSWKHAVFLCAIGLALGVPAAGHTLSAAGGTPGRLVLAVVPLFFWPIAVLVRRFWPSHAFRVVVVVLALMSLHAAASYNLHHIKSVGTLQDARISGWAPNLAFPFVREDERDDTPANLALLFTLIAAGVVACAYTFRAGGRSAPIGVREPKVWIWPVGVLGAALLLTAMTSANGLWRREDYAIGDADARRRAANALVTFDHCRVCFTSATGPIDWARLQPNPAHDLAVDTSVNNRTLRLTVRLVGDDTWAGFGRVRVDFGDRTEQPFTGIVEQRELSHEYKAPGEYLVVTLLKLADGSLRIDRRQILISAAR